MSSRVVITVRFRLPENKVAIRWDYITREDAVMLMAALSERLAGTDPLDGDVPNSAQYTLTKEKVA